MLTLPSMVLGLVCALLLGTLYHAVRGEGGWHLLFFWGLSVLGFAGGHYLGFWSGWQLWPVGSLDVGLGALGSLVVLIAGEWLSRIEVKKESGV